MSPEEQQITKSFIVIGAAGLLAGLGSLLASNEALTLRIVIGRAISSVSLGLTASIGLLWFPTMNLEIKVGIACFLASIGTSGLERLYQIWRGK